MACLPPAGGALPHVGSLSVTGLLRGKDSPAALGRGTLAWPPGSTTGAGSAKGRATTVHGPATCQLTSPYPSTPYVMHCGFYAGFTIRRRPGDTPFRVDS